MWPMRIVTITLTTFLLLVVSGCGQPVGSDVHQYNPERDKDCMGCALSGADLKGADLSDADLTHADLYGANLSNVELYDADLTAADLTHADLSGANLSHADLTGANPSHADLTGANLDGVIGADFSRAKNVPSKYLKD